jgi:hypothetical protein
MKVAVPTVFDELVARELLRTAEASVRLERVLNAGAHLPAEQVQARLQPWRGS